MSILEWRFGLLEFVRLSSQWKQQCSYFATAINQNPNFVNEKVFLSEFKYLRQIKSDNIQKKIKL